MVSKKLKLGILVMVLVFGMTVISCEEEPEEEQYGAETINGVWYKDGIKTSTVITISNGVGILTSVDYNATGFGYAKYVNGGLIKIGDVVFRNIVYIGYEKEYKRYTWSYDIWYEDGMGYTDDPDWRNNQRLEFYTKDALYHDELWANYGNKHTITFKK